MRILFLADTHLGFDYPFRPRVSRNRRGPDFFRNYRHVLSTAAGGIDAVIHGGDLFFRCRIPASLVDMAFEPLRNIADRGIPVYIVPGNHECSRIPYGLLSLHPNIHIFDAPKTFVLEKNGLRVGLAGFPYHKRNIRSEFPVVLEKTGWKDHRTRLDVLFLCLHHCFEGARVGPNNFTFRTGYDVIKTSDVPDRFHAVLSGHIHRHQILETDLRGNRLSTPILYPGSIERTSFAEKDETKGFLFLDLLKTAPGRARELHWAFRPLPTRPMYSIRLENRNMKPADIPSHIKAALAGFPSDSIVKIELPGDIPERARTAFFSQVTSCLSPESFVRIGFSGQRFSRRI